MGDGRKLTHSGMHISRCLHNTFGRFKGENAWLISSQSQTREKLDCIICLPCEGEIWLFCAKASTPAYSHLTVLRGRMFWKEDSDAQRCQMWYVQQTGFYIVSFSGHLMHMICRNDYLIVWFCESDLYLMLELKSIRFDQIIFLHCLWKVHMVKRLHLNEH